MPALRILARLKTLRGTPLDIFGWTSDRRQERRDLERYQEDLAVIRKHLDASNYGTAVALAELPDKLRGYGPVKDKNRRQLLAKRAPLLEPV